VLWGWEGEKYTGRLPVTVSPRKVRADEEEEEEEGEERAAGGGGYDQVRVSCGEEEGQ